MTTNTLNHQNELYELLISKFSSGLEEFVTIKAYDQKGESKGIIADHKDGAKGLDAIKEAIRVALTIDTHYIIVSVYSSNKAAHSRPLIEYKVFLVKESESNNEIQEKDYFQTPEYLKFQDQQFSGLGGLPELLNTKSKLAELSFESKKNEFERDQMQIKLAESEKENAELDKENEELNDLNNKLIEENKGLQKYIPGENKIMGLNPTLLLGSIAERAVLNIVKKAPNATQTILGINETAYKSFLGEIDESVKEEEKPINKEVTKVEFEEEENLSHDEKLKKKYADGVAVYLRNLGDEDLKKIDLMFKYFASDISKIDGIIEYIKSTE